MDAAYAELTADGYHGGHLPWDAFWGQRYAVMHDPDSLTVRNSEQLPLAVVYRATHM